MCVWEKAFDFCDSPTHHRLVRDIPDAALGGG